MDRSLQPLLSDIVLLERFNERYILSWSKLISALSKRYGDDWNDIIVIGVITASIHHFRKAPSLPEHADMSELDLHSLLIVLGVI